MTFRIFPSRNSGIVRPGIKKLKPLPDLGIIFATKNDLDLFKKRFKVKGGGFNFLMSQIYNLGRFSIAGPYFGAPYAVSLLENMACAGVEKFIFIGWCGSFADDLFPGDIVLSESAFSDEGTSKSYIMEEENKFFPDKDLYLDFKAHFLSSGENIKDVPVFSTDAIYRETEEKIGYFKSLGAKVVDMENSAIFSASDFLALKSVAVNIVSDKISNGKWTPFFSSKEFKKGREDLIDGVVSYVNSR